MNPLAKLGEFARKTFHAIKDKTKTESEERKKDPYYSTDKFWLTRWIRDLKYQRVGLTTITWLGEEYGYRMDIERIPKKQLDVMRRSLPYPVHKSNCGWNEWIMVNDTGMTPFPEVAKEGAEYYQPTAIDLYLYMVNKDIDNALTFSKKSQVPIDGKMLLLVLGGVAVLLFFMLGAFS